MMMVNNRIAVVDRHFLEEHNACTEGKEWFLSQGALEPIAGINNLIANDKLDWANWLLVRLLTHEQKVLYAVYAAKQVLKIFEKSYPKDKRPRKAIEAALKWAKNPTAINRTAAVNAAYAAYAAAKAAADAAKAAAYAAHAAKAAADAAADAAAYAAAKAAAYAADAADAAADAAAYAAANAAAYAADAAYAAANAAAKAAANAAMKKKILLYGIKLLKENQ